MSDIACSKFLKSFRILSYIKVEICWLKKLKSEQWWNLVPVYCVLTVYTWWHGISQNVENCQKHGLDEKGVSEYPRNEWQWTKKLRGVYEEKCWSSELFGCRQARQANLAQKIAIWQSYQTVITAWQSSSLFDNNNAHSFLIHIFTGGAPLYDDQVWLNKSTWLFVLTQPNCGLRAKRLFRTDSVSCVLFFSHNICLVSNYPRFIAWLSMRWSSCYFYYFTSLVVLRFKV